MTSCTRRQDGDYQSCESCHKYVKCTSGKIAHRTCEGSTVWDDKSKRCEWKSTTCRTCRVGNIVAMLLSTRYMSYIQRSVFIFPSYENQPTRMLEHLIYATHIPNIRRLSCDAEHTEHNEMSKTLPLYHLGHVNFITIR